MISISLCMIVKNEEDVIGRCLSSVEDLADEIIIADTGSTDRTKEIIREYTDKIYDFPWRQDFAAARNFAFSKASMDYQMWLDADDVLTEENREKFRELKETLDPSTDIVMMKYHTAYDNHGNPSMTYYRERLMRRDKNFLWVGRVHEVIPPSGTILYSEAAVSHKKLHPSDPDRNLKIYESMLAQGQDLDPRHRFYYARELRDHQRYQEAAAQFETFLDDGLGWEENNISACQDLADCYEKMGESGRVLPALTRSFAYDIPRAEVCCAIGFFFMKQSRYPQAIYWYEQATKLKPDARKGGFIRPECSDFIPYIQLCVCYDKLGDFEQALACHRKAQALKPENPSVLHNEAYFASKTKPS